MTNLGHAYCVKETEKAICVSVQGMDGHVWIPKSQVHENSEVYKNDTEGDLIVSEFWARKQGWV